MKIAKIMAPNYGPKNHYKIKLEIWGKAQRKSAWRPKSDWGNLEE